MIPLSCNATGENDEDLIVVPEGPTAKRARLLKEYPEYYTVSDAARELRIDKRTVMKIHQKNLKTITVEGWVLYNKISVALYSNSYKRADTVSRISFGSVECERMRRICETYYRTQLDRAPPELLALAKKVAKL